MITMNQFHEFVYYDYFYFMYLVICKYAGWDEQEHTDKTTHQTCFSLLIHKK